MIKCIAKSIGKLCFLTVLDFGDFSALLRCCNMCSNLHVLKPDGGDVSTKDGSDIQCDPDPHETHQMLGFWTVRNSKSVL